MNNGLIRTVILVGFFLLMAKTAGWAGYFTDNGDGTITDHSTGLMWMQATADADNNGIIDFNDRMSWQQAIAWCENQTLAGYSDWRLPDIEELRTLVDYRRYSPAIRTRYFPDTRPSNYWSSTPDSTYTDFAWFIYFKYGYESYYFKATAFFVRSVRSVHQGRHDNINN